MSKSQLVEKKMSSYSTSTAKHCAGAFFPTFNFTKQLSLPLNWALQRNLLKNLLQSTQNMRNPSNDPNKSHLNNP